MKLLVIVNDAEKLEAAQTTSMLLVAASQRGWDVHVAGIDDVALLADDRIVALARPVREDTEHGGALVRRLKGTDRTPLDLVDGVDLVMVRTNPGRLGAHGPMHDAALLLLSMVVDRGGRVVNDPVGLMKAASKLYLGAMPPAFRPRTLVTRDPGLLRAFVRERGERCVLKPLQGTRGEDVFFVDGADPENLGQIIDVLVRGGVAMAQDYVPEAAEGDTRLIVLDGEPLVVDDRVAAVRRVPGEGELRSNVAQGGRPKRAVDVDAVLAAGRAIGPILKRDGILLAGLDIIGGKAVEVNVFSPGGFKDMNRFQGVDFVAPVLDALAARAR